MSFPTAEDSSPAVDYRDIDAYDTNLPGGECRAIWVGSPGTFKCVSASGHTGTFSIDHSGVVPVRAIKVLSSGLSAENLVALY